MTKAQPAHSTTSTAPPSIKERFLSLDFFRGLTMFLLIGESTLLYEHLRDPGSPGRSFMPSALSSTTTPGPACDSGTSSSPFSCSLSARP